MSELSSAGSRLAAPGSMLVASGWAQLHEHCAEQRRLGVMLGTVEVDKPPTVAQ